MSKHNTNSVFLFFFSPVSSWRPPRSTCGSGEYINPASCLCTSVTSQQWGRELCISFLPLCVGFHPQLHVCSSVLLPVSCRLFMVISCLRAEAAAARHAERLFRFNQNYLKQSWAARSVSGLVTSEVTRLDEIFMSEISSWTKVKQTWKCLRAECKFMQPDRGLQAPAEPVVGCGSLDRYISLLRSNKQLRVDPFFLKPSSKPSSQPYIFVSTLAFPPHFHIKLLRRPL